METEIGNVLAEFMDGQFTEEEDRKLKSINEEQVHDLLLGWLRRQ